MIVRQSRCRKIRLAFSSLVAYIVGMKNALRYRVNFGNGQVHDLESKSACVHYIADYGDSYSFLQWQEPETGDWFRACGDYKGGK